MWFRDLGLIAYSDAWELQRQAHDQVLQGGEEGVFFLEHTPVVTFGRRGETPTLLVPKTQLALQGVDLVESDRGGDVTFHGPGQLVAYPIVSLRKHNLLVGSFVKTLEQIVIDSLKVCGIETFLDPHAIGVWVRDPQDRPAKICALGVRIKAGISMHGIALNLSTDLNYFNLINPCGLGKPAATIHQLLREKSPSMPQLKSILQTQFEKAFKI